MLLKKESIFLLLSLFAVNLKAQTVEGVIAKYIRFTGGEKHWKKINAVTSSGTYNYGGIEFPFEAWSKAPNLYKYVVSANGKYFAQAFNGKEGWKIDQFKDETAKTILIGKPARAMANEADVELQNRFINYKRKGNQAILEGKDSAAGELCYKVKFITIEADSSIWFFSVQNFALLKKQAVSKNAELDGSLLDTYYSDYRKVHGITMPYKLISKVNDQTILTIEIKKIELNTFIPDSIFKP